MSCCCCAMSFWAEYAGADTTNRSSRSRDSSPESSRSRRRSRWDSRNTRKQPANTEPKKDAMMETPGAEDRLAKTAEGTRGAESRLAQTGAERRSKPRGRPRWDAAPKLEPPRNPAVPWEENPPRPIDAPPMTPRLATRRASGPARERPATWWITPQWPTSAAWEGL